MDGCEFYVHTINVKIHPSDKTLDNLSLRERETETETDRDEASLDPLVNTVIYYSTFCITYKYIPLVI